MVYLRKLTGIMVVIFLSELSFASPVQYNTIIDINTPPMLDENNPLHKKGAATVECVILASKKYQVASNVLLALSSKENGRNNEWQCKYNVNNTCDVGHFQINSAHFKKRTKSGKPGLLSSLSIKDVAERGCYNAEVAAWMLHRHLQHWTPKQGNDSYWRHAANYHSKTPSLNQKYQAELKLFSFQWGQYLTQRYKTHVKVSN